MTEETIKPEDKANSKKASKGERLRSAREALDLEVSEAAAKLCFETRFILALENDDYSMFAGSAYLYGYMRAYVKLLGLPLDEFVNELKNIEDENEIRFESIGENISYQAVAKSDNKKWLVATLLGLLFLIIAISSYVLLQADGSVTNHSNVSIERDAAVLGQRQRSIPIPLIVKDVQAANKKNEEEVTANEVVIDKSATAQVANKDTSTARLLLEYKTDSWTDIRDADGKRLVYRMVEKGNRLQLESSSTYSILLGYSPGVKVSWNDQPFNLSEYERENIAYFVIGEKNKAVLTPIAPE